MKLHHLLLAILITAIWGINFSVIKLGLTTVDPFILAGIRFTLCALPALFLSPNPMSAGVTSSVTDWFLVSAYGDWLISVSKPAFQQVSRHCCYNSAPFSPFYQAAKYSGKADPLSTGGYRYFLSRPSEHCFYY